MPRRCTQSPRTAASTPGALEREHLIAVSDPALGEHHLAGRHLLEQRERVLEVGLLPARADVLDQERVGIEQVEHVLQLVLVGDLEDDVEAQLGGHRLHLGEPLVLVVECLRDQHDAVGSGEAALVQLVGIDQDPLVEHRQPGLGERGRHRVAGHRQAAHPGVRRRGQKRGIGPGDAQHEGDLLPHHRLGERADRIEVAHRALEGLQRPGVATLLHRPPAGVDHAVNRGHRPPVGRTAQPVTGASTASVVDRIALRPRAGRARRRRAASAAAP